MENGMLQNEQLRKLQLVILDMLIQLDAICRKHDIKYMIVAGTLLGAIRHGGFIPWDDDIDVTMLRDDYVKFREACKTDLDSNKYFFQDHSTDSGYRWGYARIRRKGSEFLRKGHEHLKMQTGIFLDIFPSDNIPDFYPIRLVHCFECFLLRKVLYSEVGKISERRTLKRFIYKFINVIPVEFVHQRFENMAKYWNGKKAKYNRTLAFPPRAGAWLGTPRRWDVNATEVEFEGHKFFATKYYDEYLTWRFGDYMKLPPPEKRHWHPATLIKLPED